MVNSRCWNIGLISVATQMTLMLLAKQQSLSEVSIYDTWNRSILQILQKIEDLFTSEYKRRDKL